MKKILQVLITTAFVGMLQLSWGDNTGFLQKPVEYAKIIENNAIQLVDVRKPDEYSAGTIGHAQNIDYLADGFAQQISILDKNRPVYIFCRSGARSEKARKVMLDAGFTEVYDLEGGYMAWENWEKMSKAGQSSE